DGRKIHSSAKVKLLKIKESFRTLLIERMPDFAASAAILAEGHSFSSLP
ncbi:MAG: hypothetical protein HQK53_08485, partial [Oligoflexia bacterium]|nr:hypothetical protein [Oligoflexia bacterium]